MIHPTKPTAPAPAQKKNLCFKVFGVGGAGGNAVNHLLGESLEGISFVAMNTDLAALAQCAVPAQLVLGEKLMRGLGTGGDVERGREAAEADLPKIRDLCAGADIVFIA